MAGQFESVIGIQGIAELATAVDLVLRSRERAGATGTPIAVLVQPLVEPIVAGVAFGIDPVTGRADRRLVTAVAGQAGPLVSGETDGARYLVSDRRKVIEVARGDGPSLSDSTLQRILSLLEDATALFGAPQDIEWAIDGDDRLWLLQSRPVTSENRGTPSGPVYGPGPVAETFPEPLTELECELWVPPLREAVAQVVQLTGSASAKDLATSEVVVAPGGRVAIDLKLAGDTPSKRTLLQRLSPLAGLRKLRSAWRVGRLRSALPQLAERLVDQVDADLEAVPHLDSLTSRQLIALLYRGRQLLKALHGHEMLMGALSDVGCGRLTGASVALRVLAEARSDGLDDATILQRSPVVLALTAPAIRAMTELPPAASAPPDTGRNCNPATDHGVLREALRLRTRWIHEVTGRAAWELGERFTRSGALPSPEAVRHLSLVDLEAIVTKRAVPSAEVISSHAHRDGDPLPARFQLSERGVPIAVRRSSEVGGGTGAGGGVGSGAVSFDAGNAVEGAVLVTPTLAPGLGPVLPRLAGIVSETGSVLSHLAILARELGVPVVVGYPDAMTVFSEGEVVVVNGDSGEVTREGP